MSVLYTRVFWAQVLERAIKTFAQTLVATWGTASIADVGVNMMWLVVGNALIATVLSVLTSVGSASVTSGGKGEPSLVNSS